MIGWGLTASYTVNNNKFISQKSNQLSMFINSGANDIPSKITANNNYYASPIGTTDLFYIEQPSTGADRLSTLAQWKTFSSQDAASLGSPITITDTLSMQLYYNDTKTTKIVGIAKPMIDLASTKYVTSVSLEPFKSKFLITDPNPAVTNNPTSKKSVLKIGSKYRRNPVTGKFYVR
jgi:hypothetical protein